MSTLLAVNLNKLIVIYEDVKTRRSICYVEQELFIMSQIVKENILFGEPYDEERLNKVIEVCFLKTDRAVLKWIETFIGEIGINVNGYQKGIISITICILKFTYLLTRWSIKCSLPKSLQKDIWKMYTKFFIFKMNYTYYSSSIVFIKYKQNIYNG